MSDSRSGSGRRSENDTGDRRLLRRALLAGGVTAFVAGAVLAVGLSGGGPAAVAAGMWLGVAVGGFVAAGWLLAALALDVVAGVRPSRRRLLWTGGLTVLALLLPVVALAAGTAAT